MRRAIVLGAIGAALSATALAQVTDIDSVVIQERRFNDYPNSNLVTTVNFPSEVSFNESAFGDGNFANQHLAWFSSDGVNHYEFQNSDYFDISVDVTLSVGSESPRKEAGFRMDTVGGESFFVLTSDGEVAAFGGPFPFFSFGGDAYTPGTTANMRMIYTPDDDTDPNDGDAATIEYIFNGASSGALNFSNLENGIITGSDMAMYVQNQPDDSNSGDFSNASFRNIEVVPEPATLAILGLGLVFAHRRRK